MTATLAVLAYVVLCILGGLGVVALVRTPARGLPPERWLPLAFLLGWLVHGWMTLAMIAVLGRTLPWVALLAPAAAGIVAVALRWRTLGPSTPAGSPLVRILRHPTTPLVVLVLLGFALVRLLVLAQVAHNFTLLGWDGKMIWDMKARILFHEATVFTGAWTDPNRVHFHPDYPLLMPAAFSGIYTILGSPNNRVPATFLAAVMAFFTLLSFDVFRRRGSVVAAAVGAFLVAGAAFRMDYGRTNGTALQLGVADFPLSVFAFAAFALAMEAWATGRFRNLPVAAAMAGGCMLMKSEGSIAAGLWLTLNGGLVLFRRLRGGPNVPLPVAIIALGVLALVCAPWIAIKPHLHNFYEERFTALLHPSYVGPILRRLPTVASMMAEEMFRWENWGLFWPAYLTALVASLAARCRGDHYWLDVVVFAWLAAYAGAYLLTPLHLGYHIPTSVARLFSHPQPTALASMIWKVHELRRALRARPAGGIGR